MEEKKIKVKRGSFSTIILCLLIICAGLFAYKKTGLDGDGKYATSRFTYTVEYGFCMLITYHPNYQRGDAKGFAVTNIPLSILFTEREWIQNEGEDKADSKDLLKVYQALAVFGDNNIIDHLSRTFSESGRSTKSVDVGSRGKYFIIHANEIGLYE